ncbi:MAG: 3-dehydroquinate synthase [Anaerolineales bacterium]|nr:3-dehydroquinate synthase [Anaerolineales bacterium]
MTYQNIVLTGFMGTGKTVVGKAVAERLGRIFIDMDEVIQRKTGKEISAIFAEDGEPAFRTMEAELCLELSQEHSVIIATGGGALVSPRNRELMSRSGVVICLTASPDEIAQRLLMATDRPLLATADRTQRITALMEQRAAAYSALPHHVSTSGQTVEEVADAVIRLARRVDPHHTCTTVTHREGSYDILIGEGLMAEAGELMRRAGLRPGLAAVVTNPQIRESHAARLVSGLRDAGFQPVVVEVPEGEAYKTLGTMASLYDDFVAAGLDRRSPVIALGGGVVGDMAGFAAASYLRGVPFVQIPTSLLSMVDASVGGKTGVDLPQGKNLVGAFKQPALVVIDPETLSTLPSAEFRSGLAEVVKHGIIGDPELFEALEAPGGVATAPLPLSTMIRRAVQVKVRVVQEDPFEQGRRAVLNLGHTFGHALETLSDFSLRHGEGVSIGIAAATRLAARLELCDPALVDRVEALLLHLALPIRYPRVTPEQVLRAMSTDKKRVGARLRFVLPRAIGDADMFDDVEEDAVLATLAEIVSPDLP